MQDEELDHKKTGIFNLSLASLSIFAIFGYLDGRMVTGGLFNVSDSYVYYANIRIDIEIYLISLYFTHFILESYSVFKRFKRDS